MVGTAWRLTYIDSGGTKRTIAELGQNTGAKNIDRIRYILNRKNPWIMKVFTDPSLLASFPNEVSDFQNSEPEILFEEYDGSWTTRGRFYSASQTNEDNEFAIQLLDFYHKLMKQEVSVSSTTTHIVDVLEKALPSGYVVDAPASGDVSGGYPSVDDYSCKNTQRRKVFREITRDHNWSLFFLPEQDGNGDWKVRFEPDGYGGTVENLDSSTDAFKFKNWKPPRNKNLVTKTRVQGVDSNGNQIVGTAENTTIRDKYLGTNATDHNFKSFKVGYLESQTEADTIAENRLVPGPNATSVKDSGVISNIIYPQDVVNDSFGIIDSFRGIDDTFTCVKQENFYPSNESYLHMEFEQEKLEEAAEGEENLRDERARLYPKSQTDVGGQTIDQSQSNTTTASADNATTEDDQDPIVGGNTGTSNVTTASNSLTQAEPAAGNSSAILTLDFLTGDTDFSIVNAWIQLNGGQKSTTTSGKDFTITNNDTSNTILSENGVCAEGNFFQAVDFIDGDIEGDEIEMSVTDNDSIEYSYGFSVAQMAEHTHAGFSDGGSLQAAGHNHNVNVNDGGHGAPTDPSEHELQGQTETGQNVDISTEDKTDR